MAAAFITGKAQDVCQVNWNWLYNYSADGSKFVDLNTVSKFLDLTQWDDAAMDAGYVANSQQCVPVSMTGRIFFWNMTTFNKAGTVSYTHLNLLLYKIGLHLRSISLYSHASASESPPSSSMSFSFTARRPSSTVPMLSLIHI